MKVTFDHSSAESEQIRTFYFVTDKPVRYTAGQFTEITLPHKNEDDRGHKRWFTLSSSPADQFLSITTRLIGDDGSSFKRALEALEPGTVLDFAEPMGDFVLPKDVNIPLVFVAGGIGITPFHSMLTWLAQADEKRPIKLIHAVSNEDDIIFQDTFKHAGVHATTVVSKPSAAWGGLSGQLNADRIIELTEPTTETLIYLSGPEPMTEALTKGLEKGGFPSRNLVTDYFPGYTQF